MLINTKRLKLCLVVLLILMFFGVGNVFGTEQPANEYLTSGGYPLIRAETSLYGTDQAAISSQEADQEKALYLAEGGKAEEGREEVMSAECAAFAKDRCC